ncbi:MAG: tetratricopeptide repeat protein [Acidobacteriota bacterium]
MASPSRSPTLSAHRFRWRPLALGVLTASLIGGGLIFWRSQTSSQLVGAQAEAMLQQVAASAGLTLDGRLTHIPIAKIAPVHRGDGDDDQPQLQLKATRQMLEQELIRRPTPDGHRTLGRYYLAEGKPLVAFAHLQLAIQQFPDDASLHSDLGLVLLEVARTSPPAAEEALDTLDFALRREPNLLEARYNRARALEMLGRWAEARSAWQDYVQRDPNSVWGAAAHERLAFLERYGRTTPQP